MKKYILENLNCGHCASVIETELKKQDYVTDVSIDFSTSTMLIETNDISNVENIILSIEPDIRLKEFKRGVIKEATSKTEFHPRKEFFFTIICVILFVFALLYHLCIGPNDCTDEKKLIYVNRANIICLLIFIITYIVSGYRVFYKAFLNIKRGGLFDENCLMTIATLGAFAINAFGEAAGVMIFFKVGEFLQELSIFRSRKNIKALLEIRPDYANLIKGNEISKVLPEYVETGSEILVKAGEKIPLDGQIISGVARIDTSALTGESVPRTYKEKDIVLAGMININGLLKVKVLKTFEDSSIAKILELVENATHRKAKTELFFTTFAKYYTPIIILIALITAFVMPFLWHNQDTTLKDWIYRSLVMLMISCPCALVVSIPLTYFGGIGGASKKGILIKGSSFLDALKNVHNIVFDKTGTLTKGVFRLHEIVPFNNVSKEELLSIAAIIETHSNHPIALSIIEATKEKYDLQNINDISLKNDKNELSLIYNKLKGNLSSKSLTNYEEISGQGICALFGETMIFAGNALMMKENSIPFTEYEGVGTVVYIALDKLFIGYLIINDECKDDTEKAIKEIKKMGIESLFILSGDNEKIVENIAKKLNINNYHANLLPEDKISILQKIIDNTPIGKKTIFVGDGINDAPVIALSDIGISMGNLGSDSAIETADIVIMNDSLTKIPELLSISKKTRTIIYQNIYLALGVKSLFLVLGFFGIASMWEAVFADVGVTLIAVLNAGRILKFRYRKPIL